MKKLNLGSLDHGRTTSTNIDTDKWRSTWKPNRSVKPKTEAEKLQNSKRL